MTLLTQVRQQFQNLSRPKPGPKGSPPPLPREGMKAAPPNRVHVYRSGSAMLEPAMEGYAQYATVYSVYTWVHKAVSMIAENINGLPVRVVTLKDKPLENHPLSLLFAKVNEESTPVDLWTEYVIHMMLGGESFYEIVPDGHKRPAELWMRRPDFVDIVPDATQLNYPTALGYIYHGEDHHRMPIDGPWMVHDKFFNPLRPWRGLAPITAVREGITTDMFTQGWSKAFLRNSARPDFALIAPQGITQSERDRYEAEFMRDHQGVEKAGLPVILEEGVTDIKTFSFPPKDIEWLQQREVARDEVGAIFGVPDEIMGFGKNTYENYQTALEVFWTLTLLPLTRRRDMTLTHHFRRYNLGLGPDERIATDLSGVGVLQEDLAPKVDLARKYWEMGVPFNTLDKTLGLGIGPVEGGDVGYLASSVTPVEQVLNPPEPPPAIPGDEKPPKPEPEAHERMILPPAAKDGAIRVLKKVIQQAQDEHLRVLREGGEVDWTLFPGLIEKRIGYDDLYRWVGKKNSIVISSVQSAIYEIRGDHDAVNAAYTTLKSDESLTRLLEVAATQPFFTRKNLVLRLDRDDDEAEQKVRMSLERRTTRNLTDVFNDMLETLYPIVSPPTPGGLATNLAEGYGEFADPNIEAQRVRRAFEEEQRLYDTLSRALQDGTDLGVSVAVNQLETIGYGFDWTMASVQAREWAAAHTGRLIQGITATTERGVRQAVTRWIDNGEPLEALIADITPYFGRQRAQRIASTEVTRAYQMGSETAWRESRVVAEMEWQTVRDERVCPQCGPMQGQRAPLGGTFNGVAAPPRHVNCRCFTRPVIQEA